MEHNCKQEEVLGRIQEQIKTLFETLKKQDGLIETMSKLTVEIKCLVTEMRTVKDDIGEVKKDVADLKKGPQKKYEMIIDTVVKVLIGAVVTFILVQIGLKN